MTTVNSVMRTRNAPTGTPLTEGIRKSRKLSLDVLADMPSRPVQVSRFIPAELMNQPQSSAEPGNGLPAKAYTLPRSRFREANASSGQAKVLTTPPELSTV